MKKPRRKSKPPPAPAAAVAVAQAGAPPAADPQVETRAALRHLASAGVVVVLMAASTYVVPGLERFRPWVPGERVPLTRMNERFDAVPASVGASGGYHAASSVTDEREVLGAEVAAALATQRSGSGSARPVRDPGADPGAAPTVGEEPRVEASEYQGARVRIEDPTGRGMRPFYEALRRTAEGQPGALTRVAHYGDSTIATDHLTHTVRRSLQARFGDGGHGFILISKGFMPYRHQDVFHTANEGFSIKEVMRAGIPDGRYGFGGVQVQARAGGVARFGTHQEDEPVTGRRLSRFQLFFQRQPGGGDVRLSVDEGEPIVVSTALPQPAGALDADLDAATPDDAAQEHADAGALAAAPSAAPLDVDAIHTIDVPDGAHQLELRYAGNGRVTLYGVVMERAGPGVVYDSLGLVGARASRMLNFDADHIRAQIAARGTHLLVLGFGGNDASDNTTEERYYEQFKDVIAHMRGGREDLGCLIFAPLDQAERDERGNVRTMPMVPRIVAAQRRAAFDMGCAFYDTWEAMGGSGAMQRWSRVRPALAFTDYRHATPEGYRVIAELYYQALLEGFAAYLAGEDEAPAAPASAPAQ